MNIVRPDGTPDVHVRPITHGVSFVPRRWRYDPVTGQRLPLADGASAYPSVTFSGVLVTFNGTVVTNGAY